MGKMMTMSDNKPMTLRDLISILGRQADPKLLDKPITMSSDEEGNDMLSLQGIEITKQGITLWPAHIY